MRVRRKFVLFLGFFLALASATRASRADELADLVPGFDALPRLELQLPRAPLTQGLQASDGTPTYMQEPSQAPTSGSQARETAGWTVLGLGVATGLGTVATGIGFAVHQDQDVQDLAGPTLLGGAVVVVASVIIGLVLVN